ALSERADEIMDGARLSRSWLPNDENRMFLSRNAKSSGRHPRHFDSRGADVNQRQVLEIAERLLRMAAEPLDIVTVAGDNAQSKGRVLQDLLKLCAIRTRAFACEARAVGN